MFFYEENLEKYSYVSKRNSKIILCYVPVFIGSIFEFQIFFIFFMKYLE